jgi:TolB-like protein
MRAFFALLVLSVLGARSSMAADMRVAVMEFTNASKDPDLESLGKGLQSMLTTDLATVQTLAVVERDRLKDVQAEIALGRSAGFDKKSTAKLGKLIGASHLFVGSFTVVGDKMRLDGRLIDVGTGNVLLAEQIAGEKALFFELEQQLVAKVIATLGVKVQPKEKAALARPHTADFGAFQKFSDGIQAFDDGRLDDAMRALTQAKDIDADFKLASLTLEEYERLAAQIRAKAEAAGQVEDEIDRLEKNKAIAKEVGVIKKLWQLLEQNKGNGPEERIRRVSIACALSNAYATKLGFQNRGPVGSDDLAAAGFDDFYLKRTADSLFKRAWVDAEVVFPRITPLCINLYSISADNPRPVEQLLQFQIDKARELFKSNDIILSYLSNNATVDPAAERLQLDPPGEVKLWERLYAIADKLPAKLTDTERARFEEMIAERRRTAGDFDGSTQMYAAASRHTKDSYKLKDYAKEIDKNKALKLAVGSKSPLLREYFLLRQPHESDLQRMGDPKSAERLADSVQSARDVREREMLILGDLPTWYLSGPSFNARLRTGPRANRLRAAELRYEGSLRETRGGQEPPKEPVILSTAVRGRKVTVKATIDQSGPPADWRSNARAGTPGGGEVGIAFAMRRLQPDGSIVKGAPAITVAYAVLFGDGKVRLVQITRDGEHNLAVKELADAGIPRASGKRAVEVKVDAGSVSVVVDGKRVSLPWKVAAGETEGFVGYLFSGVGYASLAQPAITVQ